MMMYEKNHWGCCMHWSCWRCANTGLLFLNSLIFSISLWKSQWKTLYFNLNCHFSHDLMNQAELSHCCFSNGAFIDCWQSLVSRICCTASMLCKQAKQTCLLPHVFATLTCTACQHNNESWENASCFMVASSIPDSCFVVAPIQGNLKSSAYCFILCKSREITSLQSYALVRKQNDSIYSKYEGRFRNNYPTVLLHFPIKTSLNPTWMRPFLNNCKLFTPRQPIAVDQISLTKYKSRLGVLFTGRFSKLKWPSRKTSFVSLVSLKHSRWNPFLVF